MRIKIFFLALLTLAVQSGAFAQSAGLSFTLGFPMDEFKDNVSRTGYGVSGNFNIIDPAPGRPFGFGLNVGYINYGSESRREYFSSTIPDVYVNVDRTNNIVNFHLLFQIMPYEGKIRPYIEGLFGGEYLFTETKISGINNGQEVASSTNLDDFAWSYGGGAGLLINLADNPSENISNVMLDLKVRYLFGTEAEYLKEGSVIIENGKAYNDITKSKTDLLTAHIGVVILFNHF